MAEKGDELLHYITKRVVNHIKTPREDRKRAREHKEAWHSRWFGIVPFALSMWVEQLKSRKKLRKR